MDIRVNFLDAYRINKSNKDFIVFTLDKYNKIDKYVLTDDLHRHYKQGLNNFRVVDVIKQEIKVISI